jgi:hypothetical protein
MLLSCGRTAAFIRCVTDTESLSALQTAVRKSWAESVQMQSDKNGREAKLGKCRGSAWESKDSLNKGTLPIKYILRLEERQVTRWKWQGHRDWSLRERLSHAHSNQLSEKLEDETPLLGLVNYIHLNPVRAGLVTVAKLRAYEWSSYPKFFKSRSPPLRRERFLCFLGVSRICRRDETI